MRKLWALTTALILSATIFFAHAAPTIHYVDLNDVDASGLVDGQVFSWNAAAGKFKPVTLSSGGGGGSSISGPAGGTVGFDANGGIVAGNRFSNLGGRASGASVNGVIVPRLNASRVYVGSDILNVLFYNPQPTFDVIWYDVDFWATVVSAGSGTIAISIEYQDAGGVKTTVIMSGFDVGQTAQPGQGSLCVPVRGSPTHGLWYNVIGTGISGNPVVNLYYQVKES